MKKSSLIILLLAAQVASLWAQKTTPTTDITVPSDTTKYQPPEQKPEPKDPKLELPDVLILGKDQYHRTVQDKKELAPESPMLIDQETAYEPAANWFARDRGKPQVGQIDSLAVRQIWARLVGGSFYTVVGDGGFWQRLIQGDLAASAWFDRSEGQRFNAKYGEGGLSGRFTWELKPQVMTIFRADYARYGRGLQEAAFGANNAKRSAGIGLFSADLQYDVDKLSDANLGVEFAGMAMTSDTSGAEADKSNNFYYNVHFDYTTQYQKTEIKVAGQYIRESLETRADSTSLAGGFGYLGLEFLHPISTAFSAAFGANLQSFKADTLGSRSRISPYARLNFIAGPRVGLSLLLSTGLQYKTFIAQWEENNYLAHRIPLQPSEETFGFKLKADLQITDQVKFQGALNRQWMQEMFYWQADSTTGLIGLNAVEDAKLTEIELGVTAELSEKTRLQVSFIDYADRVEGISDSLNMDANLNRLPYRPDFRIPVRASIQLLPDMNLTVTADLLGRRNKDLFSEARLPAIAVLHADLSKEVYKNITALLAVRNLLDSRYDTWDGYTEPGVLVLAGLRAQF